MLTRKDLKISTDALLPGVSGAGVGFRRGAVCRSRDEPAKLCSLSENVVLPEGVGCWSERYEREASVVPFEDMGGDVGDGMLGDG